MDSPAGTDVKGPYIQGRPGNRFICPSWGAAGQEGSFSVFRRARPMPDAVPAPELEAAVSGGLPVGRLGLTDACGEPLCARVVPPRVTWTAEPRD
ncbi:DUF5990 family protein [Streptomyces litmocidini]|uniref:DUF5990 family protein n=1 Tax=Streptomyces litmocidini TaxID=67318 RepID=A0ABW7UFK8_9ACTN